MSSFVVLETVKKETFMLASTKKWLKASYPKIAFLHYQISGLKKKFSANHLRFYK